MTSFKTWYRLQSSKHHNSMIRSIEAPRLDYTINGFWIDKKGEFITQDISTYDWNEEFDVFYVPCHMILGIEVVR